MSFIIIFSLKRCLSVKLNPLFSTGSDFHDFYFDSVAASLKLLPVPEVTVMRSLTASALPLFCARECQIPIISNLIDYCYVSL